MYIVVKRPWMCACVQVSIRTNAYCFSQLCRKKPAGFAPFIFHKARIQGLGGLLVVSRKDRSGARLNPIENSKTAPRKCAKSFKFTGNLSPVSCPGIGQYPKMMALHFIQDFSLPASECGQTQHARLRATMNLDFMFKGGTPMKFFNQALKLTNSSKQRIVR